MSVTLAKTPRTFRAAYADIPTGGLALQRVVEGPADERPGDAPALLWFGINAVSTGDAFLQARKLNENLQYLPELWG